MKLSKKYVIDEIHIKDLFNAPYQLILLPEGICLPKIRKSICVMNEGSLHRYALPLPTDRNLIGETIICALESVPYISFEDVLINDDETVIQSIVSKETTHFLWNMQPPGKTNYIQHALKLSTQENGGHFAPPPCPFYRLTIPLTE